jgi:hypothetical protein
VGTAATARSLLTDRRVSAVLLAAAGLPPPPDLARALTAAILHDGAHGALLARVARACDAALDAVDTRLEAVRPLLAAARRAGGELDLSALERRAWGAPPPSPPPSY